ncbi:MAG: DUF3618 domain-containing protein [Actinomycetales bacterium]
MTSTTSASGTPAVRTSPPPSGSRSPAEIEREIQLTRDRLAGTVDDIATRVKPANVAAKAKERARAQVFTPSGQLRTERVGIAGGAVAFLLLLKLIGKRREKRKQRKQRQRQS